MKTSVSPSYMKAWERAAFARGVAPLLLMDRAAEALADAAQNMLGGLQGKRLLFFCGPGNNGADGYAAALIARGRGAKAHVLKVGEPRTEEARLFYARCEAGGVPVLDEFPSAGAYDLAVDAMFGTGFRGTVSGRAAESIAWLNASGLPVVSADIPSGMNGETGEGVCVRAKRTVSFGALKNGLLLAGGEKTGALSVPDIGLTAHDMPAIIQPWDRVTAAEEGDLLSLLPPRQKNAHKGVCGRVALFAGSMGMAGAAAVAASACLRGGAGLVTVLCDAELMPVLQAVQPAAMCRAPGDPPPFDVLAMGCGLGQSEGNWRRLAALFSPEKPSVWDADALNMLAERPMRLGGRAVMTPHAGEAARLLNMPVSDVLGDMPRAAVRLNEKYGAQVLLKSAVSVLYDGKTMAFHTVGTPAQAKGGSGDALTGLLAALLAQMRDMPDSGMRAMQAACLWLGMAARRCEQDMGVYSVLPEDVAAALGPTVAEARKRNGFPFQTE